MKKSYWLIVLPLVLLTAALAETADPHGGLHAALVLTVSVALWTLFHWRVSWFYAFMLVFYVLGCWFKVEVHRILDIPYVEPSGNFGGSPSEWQEYYQFAVAIGIALVLGRSLGAVFSGHRRAVVEATSLAGVSTMQWLRLIVIAALFYAVNNALAFFVTGVNAKVSLPAGLNAPIAFMALVGFAVILSCHVARDVQARGQLTAATALAVLIVTSIASVSMASRAAVVMQSVPILLAAYYVQTRIGRHRLRAAPVVLFVIAVITVLIAVSIYRIRVYSGSNTGDTELFNFFLLESALLVVDRWVGAEAIMVAVSEPTRSLELTRLLLFENPAIGVDSIYQQLSGGKYEFLQGMTFLTLPGYFGVLALSGSLVLVLLGTLAITVTGIAFERFILWLLGERMVPVALISAALANALTQLSFPRLLVPFMFQMTALCLLIALYFRGARARPAGRRAPPGPAATSCSER